VHVSSLTFLSKAMLALPDKFHGLEDTELRYRQRYVDLFVNPDVREVFVKRAAILRALRKFFDARGYLEVETPMMQAIAGGAAAKPFKTHHNALDLDLSLRIAPELYLKRLVVGGMDRVYEINRNFRNEGIDTSHNPEFTMLEFYQAYSNYHDLMDLTQEMIAFVAQEVNGTTITNFDGVEIDLGKWTKLSMREAIVEFWPEDLGYPPGEGILNRPKHLNSFLGELYGPEHITNPEAAKKLADAVFAAWGNHPDRMSNGSHGRAIAALFECVAEEHLIQPTIIYDFPLAVSPLSKIKPGEPEWVERFEFYIGGFEVGNAFSELNDADDQRRRFEAQIEERKRGDEEAMAEVDEDYVRALGYGLPPTAGEGIGIDRLTMVLTGSKSIRDVILFPLLRPVGSKTAAE
jgi:lysyl-tRNA synthetase class 2